MKTCNQNLCSAYSEPPKILIVGGLAEGPDAPTVSNSSFTDITLNWNYNAKDGGGVPIKRFVIHSSEDSGSTWKIAGYTSDASDNSFVFPCTFPIKYQFKVAALNGVGSDNILSYGYSSEPAAEYVCAPVPETPATPAVTGLRDRLTVPLYEPTED